MTEDPKPTPGEQETDRKSGEEGADPFQIELLYRKYRLDDGLREPEALEAMERDGLGTSVEVAKVLRDQGLLDEWPVGWMEADAEKLAVQMTFEDAEYWVSRVVDSPREDRLVAILLSAQSHLASLLKSIGPAIHGIPEHPEISAGKSRCAKAYTILGSGVWFGSATIPRLRSARQKAPVLIGVDEGDEAQRNDPGIESYLLGCHDWDVTHGKMTPDSKGVWSPDDIRFGGPLWVTFRRKPWPALLSRGIVFEMKPSTDPRFSDDGAGDGLARLLRPSAI
jgi:hypothetical protein